MARKAKSASRCWSDLTRQALKSFHFSLSANRRILAVSRTQSCHAKSNTRRIRRLGWLVVLFFWCALFEEWLKKLDKHFISQGRKVLLFIDNCPAHPVGVKLNNIELKFLPPNTTAASQVTFNEGLMISMQFSQWTKESSRILKSTTESAFSNNALLPSTLVLTSSSTFSMLSSC